MERDPRRVPRPPRWAQAAKPSSPDAIAPPQGSSTPLSVNTPMARVARLRDFWGVSNDDIAPRSGADRAAPLQRVVIVDDSAGFRGLLQLALGALPGLQIVAEAADGEQAIAEVDRTNPDLVFMDVRMPNVNGLQATKQLRSDGKSMRIVLLTAHGDAIPGWLAEEAGADEVLDKSKLGERLREAVARGGFFETRSQGRADKGVGKEAG